MKLSEFSGFCQEYWSFIQPPWLFVRVFWRLIVMHILYFCFWSNVFKHLNYNKCNIQQFLSKKYIVLIESANKFVLSGLSSPIRTVFILNSEASAIKKCVHIKHRNVARMLSAVVFVLQQRNVLEASKINHEKRLLVKLAFLVLLWLLLFSLLLSKHGYKKRKRSMELSTIMLFILESGGSEREKSTHNANTLVWFHL